MSRSVRFFEIIQVLRRATVPVTAQELATKLEVNIRTIYRDLASLQASHLPIQGEAGIGYILRSGYDLPPLMFSQEELEAIAVGLSMIGRSSDDALIDAAKTASGKISDVLPKELSLNGPLHVSQWNEIPASQVEPKHLRQIIRDCAEINITYIDLENIETNRTLKPIGLLYYVDAILLAAWCGLRKDFRHFRIDRIQRWELTGEYFTNEVQALRKQWEINL